MDAESCWKAFASTGKIDHYLDYKRLQRRRRTESVQWTSL